MRTLAPYLNKSQRQNLLSLLHDAVHVNVKYRNLNFKCRVFKKWDVMEEGGTKGGVGVGKEDGGV
ncbi:hypothetical protein EON65_46710 [archaeon]|nr:MAG: hypothetical protein EON65_46710 [archaeon]